MVTTSVSWQLQHFVSVSYSKSIEEYRINKTPDPNVGQVFFCAHLGDFFVCGQVGCVVCVVGSLWAVWGKSAGSQTKKLGQKHDFLGSGVVD